MKSNWLTDTWSKVVKWATENSAYTKKYHSILEGLESGAPVAIDEVAELKKSSHYLNSHGDRMLRTAIRGSDVDTFMELFAAIEAHPNHLFVDSFYTGIDMMPVALETSILNYAIDADREDIAVFIASNPNFKFSPNDKQYIEKVEGQGSVFIYPLPIEQVTEIGMDELLEVLNDLKEKDVPVQPRMASNKTALRF